MIVQAGTEASELAGATSDAGMKLALILNRNAGTLRTLDADKVAEELSEIFRAHGHEIRSEVHSGGAAGEAVARICRERSCDGIVVGGGDGTVSAAASMAAEGGLALGVLPLGTMNLFARSLGIPLEMHAAAEALAGGTVVAIDIGVANGNRFVHHVSLGLHPRMIRVRERYSYDSRWGKMLAAVRAFWLVVKNPPRLNAGIRLDDGVMERRTASILVSNNPLGEGHLPYADDLRQGRLGLYVTTSRKWGDLMQVWARIAVGGAANDPFLEHRSSRTVEISLPERAVNASVDGELVTLETPVRVGIHHGGLKVIKPRAA